LIGAGSVLKRVAPELAVTERKLRAACLVRLPVKRDAADELLYGRRNGSFVLQITGHPSFGLPRAR